VDFRRVVPAEYRLFQVADRHGGGLPHGLARRAR
jgi:hypothetical protein